MLELNPQIEHHFQEVIQEHTAGSPQQEIRWTNLTQQQIADRVTQAGTSISRRIAAQLLRQFHFVKRKALKMLTFKQHPDRNAQFEHIAQLKAQYLDAGIPVISMDTKKKELIGNFYRAGKLYTLEAVHVLDHDFPSYGEGKVVPHGLYDLALNQAHLNLGISRDTTEFACDSLIHWWEGWGCLDDPEADELLILCDGGGSNPSNSHLFKQDLQQAANRLGLTIRVAHYPSYCSKYNPIEHRVFPHVSRACEGVVFSSVELVQELIERTQTKTGLQVTADILDKVYETGRKACESLKSTIQITTDQILPKWNYKIAPQANE